jgi:hypothetical protein
MAKLWSKKNWRKEKYNEIQSFIGPIVVFDFCFL